MSTFRVTETGPVDVMTDREAALCAALAERDAEVAKMATPEQYHEIFAEVMESRIKLAAQHKVLEQAEVALKPFANDAKGIHEDWSNERRRASLTQAKPITVGDFRRAGLAFTAIQEALA